jgi:NAD(P)-dependent dehydrogenase (short-subunit alcohol dehydrogenase family)
VAPPAPGDDPVAARVLEIVAAQTGYPTDMLDLDLDLEADLGIDTVKQAETFAAIRREWDIPRDDTLDLRSYPTLAHAIRFVHDRRPDLAAGRAPVAAGAALGAIPRRVPVPVLRPPLARCKPTGVRLETGTRVVLAPDRGGVGAALTARLEKRGVEVLVVDPDGDAGSLASRLEAWREEGAVGGVYWLPALDDEGDLAALDQAAFRAEVDRRVKRLHLAARLLYDALGAPGSFLVSATRLGGRHGCDAAGATAPLGGAVAGFTKAFKRERPLATVKVVDFPASRKTAALADLLIEETLADPGAVEVGYAADLRWTVGLAERPPAGEGVALGAETVFAVTGAAGGIVSAIVADLAAASAGTFYLLDLAAEPDPGDPDLDHFTADREGLRRDLFERIGARGERATPAKVDRELAAIERRHAAREAIRAVERAGGTARYRSLDLRDAAAVERAVSEIAEAHGRIDVLIHAAGLEVSHLLTDKGPEEFDRVFDVKAEGWHNLLRAARGLPLGATVVFSSIAGRFGNAGQTDYSAANELLAKSSSALRRTRPETRAVILDWSAWAGIGMATRGSIPRMMERAGIDMLPPEAAIPVVRRELQAGTRGEVVVAQGLGALLEEWDATGGLDPAAVTAAPPRPLIGEVVAMDLRRGLVVETELDPRRQPFLNDHRIDGTAVLPGVMGIEAFAEAAGLLFPGWRVAAVEDVEFLTPFKFYRDQPRRISVEAVLAADGGGLIADCRLVGRRTLPAGGEPAATTHFTARVRLAREPAEVTRTGRPEAPAGAAVGAEQVYGPYFHGPAYRVVESAWRAGEAIVGRMPATLPADHLPEEAPTVLDPRQIELCFQTAGLWELGREGRMGLPQHIDRVRVLPRREVDGDGPIHAVVRPHADGSAFDAEVVDDSGTLLLQVEGYRTIPLPGAVPEAQLAPLRAAVAGA